jgi:hypothetical protein
MRDLRSLEKFALMMGEDGGGVRDPVPSDQRDPSASSHRSGADGNHVSVSLPNRCPNWTEMEHVKRQFFRDDEVAMQLHVPPSDHINLYPNCLHLWRPHNVAIPRPPSFMVA